jgi:hypothetical protein
MISPKSAMPYAAATTPDKAALMRHLREELQALLHILPGEERYLSPGERLNDEAVEHSFDNMPV